MAIEAPSESGQSYGSSSSYPPSSSPGYSGSSGGGYSGQSGGGYSGQSGGGYSGQSGGGYSDQSGGGYSGQSGGGYSGQSGGGYSSGPSYPPPAAPEPPSRDNEHAATVMLSADSLPEYAKMYDKAKSGSAASPTAPSYGGSTPYPPPQSSSMPQPTPYPPPPMATPPQSPGGMAQGQKTVILQPDALPLPGMPSPSAAQVPPEQQGKLLIFVPDTDPILFELMPGITTIGRGMENHLVLGDPYASRKHSVITHKSGSYTFEDTGSDNGTLINGQRVSSKPLVIGDVIEIGSVLMRFVSGPLMAEYYQVPLSSAQMQSGRGKGGQVERRKKKASTLQLALLISLLVATVALLAVMAILFLGGK
ncbi:MAG: FHA domain-containing protein [Bradymonadales bacterium]|nr:FHA domain-containing protein [Bradymonadales bacterium]